MRLVSVQVKVITKIIILNKLKEAFIKADRNMDALKPLKASASLKYFYLPPYRLNIVVIAFQRINSGHLVVAYTCHGFDIVRLRARAVIGNSNRVLTCEFMRHKTGFVSCLIISPNSS